MSFTPTEKIYKVKGMIPGVNASPMHPWRRSYHSATSRQLADKFFKEREGKYRVRTILK